MIIMRFYDIFTNMGVFEEFGKFRHFSFFFVLLNLKLQIPANSIFSILE